MLTIEGSRSSVVAVEGERIGQASIREKRVRDEQVPPRRAIGLLFECGQCVLGHRVVGLPKGIPAAGKPGSELGDLAKLRYCVSGSSGGRIGIRQHPVALDVCWLRGDDSFQRGDGFVGSSQRQIAGAKKQTGRKQVRFQREGAFEWCERLVFVAPHRERHPEVHQEPRFVGERLEQLPIHLCGLLEPPRLHCATGFVAARGEVVRLRLRRNGYQQHQHKRHGAASQHL